MTKHAKRRSPMDHALGYLAARDRTVWEMQAYLDKQEFGEADVDATIDRLKELGLLDDRRYAKRFVRTRLASKPVSRAHLYRQLLEHRIERVWIDEALSEIHIDAELENASAVAAKFWRQFRALEPELRRQRVLSHLQARGFGYEISQKALASAQSESEEEA